MIDKEYGSVFKITFYESDEAKGRSFAAHIRNVDAVFAMTSFMNHGIDVTIKNSGSRYHRVHGGMSKLRDKLNDYMIDCHDNQTPA